MKNVKQKSIDATSVRKWTGTALALGILYAQPLLAQSLGISTQGVSGGLVIPSAQVLPLGSLALGYGNYQEPQFGAAYSTQQNISMGLGLLPYVELFGRFADYNTPVPGSILLANGIRDLSANIKAQLPLPWANVPKVAVGVNDVSGGASFFKSSYLVASDQYGPVGVSLGYAKGDTSRGEPTFDGAFGGLSLRLGESGVSVLVEHDGKQKHGGLRWQSQPLAALGNAQFSGTVQRSVGAVTPSGADADSSRFALSLQVPMDGKGTQALNFDPATAAKTLPSLDKKPDPQAMQPTAQDRLASLRKALTAVGLERVRVGLRDGLMGLALMVEYENHRYAHNEADALGLVLGLAAEMAPPGTQRVHAVSRKDGLRLYETSVGVTEYREFLRGAPAAHVRDSLTWDRLPTDYAALTRWIDEEPGFTSRVRVLVKPDLNYTLGTEVGAFDYALAADVQVLAPLWTGARLFTSTMVPLDHSSNMDEGAVFDLSRQRSGVKTVALQQSFWLGRQLLSNIALGQFHYDKPGVQAQATLFIPDSDDMLRWRGAVYEQAPGELVGQDRAFATSYRRALTPTMWLEAGVQRYSDGSTGPSVEWNRWFGDIGVQIFYRRGGDVQFAGLQMSLPLTPRRGMQPNLISFGGASQYALGLRTRLTTANQPANLVQPSAVRDIRLETSQDVDQLNAGRASQRYFTSQVFRMREAFYLFGMEQLE